MDFISIEKAGFEAWPAFEQHDRDGWIIRFAEGYTKRANSVNPLTNAGNSVEKQIINYEEEYNHRKLPCIFRLLSFNDNSQIETILDSRGYNRDDHSLVLVQELQSKEFVSTSLERLEVDEWMTCYCELSKKNIEDHNTHIKMINRIKDGILLVVLRRASKEVSCGLGVIHNGIFGIFDIVTHNEYRNKGCGTELINGMLSWAVYNGAHTAYVQVVAENRPAINLYKKLGYIPGYEYYYKIQNYKR